MAQHQTIDGSLQNSQVQLSQAGENAISFQNSRDNQITILKTFQLFGAGATSTPMDWDYAQEILKDQRNEIQARLRYTLEDLEHLMNVGLEWVKWASPQQVSPLQAQRRLEVEGTDRSLLNPQHLLIETFGQVGGKLLILGTPGAGKTTALLELAEQLVCGAIAQPQTIIPVIFELSTWSKDDQSIEDWLVERLRYQYNGKPDVYKTWLERKKLLPLLDGLDELGLERQKICTQKLNEFARTYPHLVVCCRVKEFEQVGIKLTNLRGSVCLEPLSDSQIQNYLETIDRSPLWLALQQNDRLRSLLKPTREGDPGLLRIPLFLTLAAKVYNPEHPFETKADLLRQYVEYQLSWDVREADRRRELEGRRWAYKTLAAEPKRQETQQILSWIARQLHNENQVELLIEKIQPRWLENGKLKRHYRLIVGLIVGLIGGLILGLIVGLIGGLIVGLIVGLIGGLDDIEPVEAFKISMSRETRQHIGKNLIHGLIYGLIVGLIVGLIYGLISGLIVGLISGLIVGLIGGLIYGLIVGLILGLILGLIYGLIYGLKQELQLRSRPNQGIKNSFQSMLWTTLFSYPLGIIFGMLLIIAKGIKKGKIMATIITTLWNALPNVLIAGIFWALLFGFFLGGGMAVVQHYCLRFVLALDKIAPWDLPQFLNFCVERRLLQRVGGRYRFLHRELLDLFARAL